jgi:hypothetical protein
MVLWTLAAASNHISFFYTRTEIILAKYYSAVAFEKEV